MAQVRFTNYAHSTLAAAATSSQTSLLVSDVSSFPVLDPGDWYYLTLIDFASWASGGYPPATREIVKVTNAVGNLLTVVRGQDSTSGQQFAAGAVAEVRLNAAAITDATSVVGIGALLQVNNLDDVGNPAAALFNLQFLSTYTGSAARSARAKLQDIVSVLDFAGVDPLGVSDSTVGVQAAITAAQGTPGAALFFPPGYYKIAGTLNVTKALTMYAHKGTMELRQATANTNTLQVGDGTLGTYNLIGYFICDGITFAKDPSLTTVCGSGASLFLNYCSGFHIRNCVFYGGVTPTLFRGMYLFQAEIGWVSNCWVLQYAGNGVRTLGGSTLATRTVDVVFSCCRIGGNGDDHIYIGDYSEGIFINDCIILTLNGHIGININSDFNLGVGGTNFFINNVNVEGGLGTAEGIVVTKGKVVQIVGGWLSGFAAGKRAVGFTSGSQQCEMTGVRVDSGYVQIAAPVVSIKECELEGNVGAEASMIVVDGATATDVHISGGRIAYTSSYGIALNSTPARVLIDGVQFHNIGGADAVSNYNGSAGPVIGSIITGDTASAGISAANTITVPLGVAFVLVTGGTTIKTINGLNRGRSITLEADAGGITLDNSGNLVLSSSPLSVTQFRSVTLTSDGNNWFESGRSF